MEFYISNGIHARARQRLRLNVIGRYHCTKKHPLSSSLKIFTIKKLAIVLHGYNSPVICVPSFWIKG